MTEGTTLSDDALDSFLERVFRSARTCAQWQPRPVPESLLRQVYDLARMGPTSANACPARFVFVASREAKERLLAVLTPGNVEKVRAAPVTIIVAWDTQFYEKLPALLPDRPELANVFAGNAALADATAFRNSSLQGAYLMLAARAVGLDCGPMSGFDALRLDAEFFPDGRWKANFLCNLGYGEKGELAPRNPRLTFEQACRIV